MKAITFVCKVNEVGEKVSKLEGVIRAMTYNCWEMLPAVVNPMPIMSTEETEPCVLVTINYDWGFKFPVPQNFEELFGDDANKKFLREEYIDKMRESWGK